MKELRDILILDDDPEIVKILSSLMSGAGISFATAGNTIEAQKMLDQFRFCAILSDMRMPVATGTQFLALIRGKNIDIPVVFLSAVSDPERMIEALGFGAFDYILKPFKTDELLAAVNKAISAGRKKTA